VLASNVAQRGSKLKIASRSYESGADYASQNTSPFKKSVQYQFEIFQRED
jgi:hypothetical protein